MFRTRITWNIYIYSLIYDCENLKIDHRGNKKESAFKSARNRFSKPYHTRWTSQLVLMAKNLPANAGDVRDEGSIPGSRRSTGGGHGNPLQYSCLEDPMDRGAWWVAVHGITKSRTRLKRLSTHTPPNNLKARLIQTFSKAIHGLPCYRDPSQTYVVLWQEIQV